MLAVILSVSDCQTAELLLSSEHLAGHGDVRVADEVHVHRRAAGGADAALEEGIEELRHLYLFII